MCGSSARADQQDQGQRHLDNDQGFACAVPFAALAQRASALAQATGRVAPAYFEDWDRPMRRLVKALAQG